MIWNYGVFCDDCNAELFLLEDQTLVCPKCGHIFPPIEKKGDMTIGEVLLLAKMMFDKKEM